MDTGRYVHWQESDMWIGCFEEFPDYLTQGESIPELEENLRDLYRDLMGGEIPGIEPQCYRKISSPLARYPIPESEGWIVRSARYRTYKNGEITGR